jgi:hypothetical protein
MRYCFCIVGWHFFEAFYEQIYRIPGDKYIISHRDYGYVASQQLFRTIQDDVLFLPNIGLDWGGYYQFNETGHYRHYDFVIYCHDDLIIKNADFVEALQETFQQPWVKVIGNGNNGTDSEFRFAKYKHRMFFPDEDDFVVRTVRGSFFAAKTEIFATIGNFPVYWRTKKLSKGNVSLRNFAYVVTKHFGIDSITYLDGAQWLDTRYLREMVRGDQPSA